MTPCAACGDPFEQRAGKGRRRLYCTLCRPVVDRSVRNAEDRVRRATAREDRVPLGRVCEWCRSPFETLHAVQRFCGELCKTRSNDQRKYQRRGKFFIDACARVALYDRDGWVCQLCMEPVARDLHYLDNWAPSLDHITPRSLGGSDDATNLRLTHRWCNIVRGAARGNLFQEAL